MRDSGKTSIAEHRMRVRNLQSVLNKNKSVMCINCIENLLAENANFILSRFFFLDNSFWKKKSWSPWEGCVPDWYYYYNFLAV